MEEEDAIKRIEEQIGKLIIIDYDPTITLLNMVQKEPVELKPPRLYVVVKAQKDYSMRTIVSTIGTILYGMSKYLVGIIQPTLNKNIKAKTWDIYQDKEQVS